MGVSGTSLENNGDGTMSVYDDAGNQTGLLVNTSATGERNLNDSSFKDEKGNDWAVLSTESPWGGAVRSSSELMDGETTGFRQNNVSENSGGRIVSMDASGYKDTGTIKATTENGHVFNINNDNKGDYFEGYQDLNSVVYKSPDPSANTAYTRATGHEIVKVDPKPDIGNGVYEVQNTDGTKTRLYSAAGYISTSGQNSTVTVNGATYYAVDSVPKSEKYTDKDGRERYKEIPVIPNGKVKERRKRKKK